MATTTDSPFIVANNTWQKVLDASVTSFPTQDYKPVLDVEKVDSSIAIQPWQIVTNIGALWGNTVDTFMRVAWPIIVGILNGTIGGVGDFIGPAGSTQDGIVRFGNATGKLGADTTFTITDGVGVGDVLNLPENGEIRTQGAGSIFTGTDSALGPIMGFNVGADTASVMRLKSGDTANSVTTAFFTGNRNPNGFVPGSPGAYYYEKNDDQSKTYIYLSNGISNDKWVAEEELSEPPVSGVVLGGKLTISSATEVQIAAGSCVLTELVAGGLHKRHTTSWPTSIIESTNLGNPGSFWVITDPGFTGAASLVERTVQPTSRVEVGLGISLHSAGVIFATVPAPEIHRDMGKMLRDILSSDDGVDVVSGSIKEIPATRTALTTDIGLFAEGLNFYNDIQQPHIIVAGAQNPITFTTIKGDGTEFNTALTTFPKTWNNSGVETALTGQRAAVSQFAIFPPSTGGGVPYAVCQLGTIDYSNFNTAVQNIETEKKVNPLWALAHFVGARIANVVISAAATNWEDGRAHIFIDSSGGGGGTTTTTSYDALTDSPGSKIGQDGRVPVVDVTEAVHEYANIKGIFSWGTETNRNTTAGTPILGKQTIEVPRWQSIYVRVTLQTAPAVSALTVDVTLGGVSIVDGALPSLGVGVLLATQDLIVLDRVAGGVLEIEPISTDSAWKGLTVEVIGNSRLNS